MDTEDVAVGFNGNKQLAEAQKNELNRLLSRPVIGVGMRRNTAMLCNGLRRHRSAIIDSLITVGVPLPNTLSPVTDGLKQNTF